MVINKLYKEMGKTVKAYDNGVVNLIDARKGYKDGPVEGTSTFPVGIGLWRGEESGGPRPVYFPQSPIMLLLHNWGALHELKGVYKRQNDGLKGPSWKGFKLYFETVEDAIAKERYFFTNFIVGLNPGRAVGDMNISDEFRSQCCDFLEKEIDIVKPSLVVILGKAAAKYCREIKGSWKIPTIELAHPSYIGSNRNSDRRPAILRDAETALRKELGIPAKRTRVF